MLLLLRRFFKVQPKNPFCPNMKPSYFSIIRHTVQCVSSFWTSLPYSKASLAGLERLGEEHGGPNCCFSPEGSARRESQESRESRGYPARMLLSPGQGCSGAHAAGNAESVRGLLGLSRWRLLGRRSRVKSCKACERMGPVDCTWDSSLERKCFQTVPCASREWNAGGLDLWAEPPCCRATGGFNYFLFYCG